MDTIGFAPASLIRELGHALRLPLLAAPRFRLARLDHILSYAHDDAPTQNAPACYHKA
jgi:hypothetical protein